MVRDGVECSVSWHAKLSQSRALAMGSSELQVRDRNLQIGPEGVENGDLVTTTKRHETEYIDVCSASTRSRCNLS